MKLRIIVCTFIAVGSLSAMAQDITQEKYQLADEQALWRNSQNAAGIALDMESQDSAVNRGVAFFDLRHQSGDYHRVQEGNQTNQLRFFTERYQKIGKWLYGYGSFDFDMGRIKQRAWSDVLRTYNANPFISGSSVFGSYDFQNFTLQAKVATVQLGHFHYGASLSYQVGDLSRLRDPRSRIRLADYTLTPSATYSIRQHTVGLSAHYHRYKEKLTGLTTVQNNPNLKYYVMSGLEYARGTVNGYSAYQREYVNHEFGGELSYGYKGNTWHSVTALAFDHGTEYAYGQYKYEPGRYYTNRYALTTQNRITSGRLLHSIDIKACYEEGYADQYNQEQITVRDGAYTTTYWQTKMTYEKRYQLKKTDLNVHYRLTVTDGDAVAAYAGMSYTLQMVSNKHLLRTSQLKYSSSLIGLEGGYGFLKKRLWAKADINYHISHQADLQLSDPTGDYACNVLLPDMEYYRANYWQGRLEVAYQLPVVIKKVRTLWFAKLYGSYLRTNNSLNGRCAGLSIGMYF